MLPPLNPSRLVGLGLLIFLGAEPEAMASEYVGSKSCAPCHAEIARTWRASHHAKAWLPARADTVRGRFDDARFVHGRETLHFRREGERFVVDASEADGEPRRYEIHSTAGIEPLQQYLVATGEGRLQALDVAWDVGKGRWYALYPDQKVGTCLLYTSDAADE